MDEPLVICLGEALVEIMRSAGDKRPSRPEYGVVKPGSPYLGARSEVRGAHGPEIVNGLILGDWEGPGCSLSRVHGDGDGT